MNMVSQTDLPEEPTLPVPCVMAAAITTCQSALTTKFEVVQLDIGLIQQDLDKIHSRLNPAELWAGHLEDTAVKYTFTIRTLQSKVKVVKYR